ncbi:MAG TPA: LysR substrate-binding domain-containing protein [Noviherbaspirillum sp.]|jgi:DNA-binding transcriptional LysR family regulator|uniref:LysR substrate-binding domain-containing protein n=1 Tax=Noviherbaspirillum sp. TaxID=1926288 RepID=UPI002F94A3A5
MDDLNDLALFLQVVDAGGFSAAERETGIAKSRLSRRVAALEAQLGVRLVQRSTHHVHVTEIGARVARHARTIVDEAEAIRAIVADAQAEPTGLVRVSASPLSGELHLSAWLADFMRLYPKVRVSLDLTNRYVDLLAERVDLALRFSGTPLQAAELVARPIGAGRMILVASPDCLERHGEPAGLDALHRFPALGQGTLESIRPWIFRAGDGGSFTHPPQPCFVSGSLLALRAAALRGAGLAYLPAEACEEALRAGELRELLPAHAPPGSTLYAVYPARRGLTTAVRSLIGFLEERYRSLS